MTNHELTTTQFIEEMVNNLDREVEMLNEGADYAATLSSNQEQRTLEISIKDADEPFVVTVFDLRPINAKEEARLADKLEETYILLSQLTETYHTQKGVDKLCL